MCACLVRNSTASTCLDLHLCAALRQIYDEWVQLAESFQDTQHPADDQANSPDVQAQERRCLTQAGHVCTDSCTNAMTRAKVESILSGVFCYSCGGAALHNLIVKWWYDVRANNRISLPGECPVFACTIRTILKHSLIPLSC